MRDRVSSALGFVENFGKAPLSDKILRVHHLWRRLMTSSVLKLVFKSIGAGTVIFKPAFVSGGDCISIGRNSMIRYGARLEVVRHGQAWTPELRIGSDVNIEQNVHIVCHDRVLIGDRVSITGHCAIVDVTHPYGGAAAGQKIGALVDGARSFVEIGEGTFVGFGAAILPNVKIGRDCVIGAGAVVVNDVPDFSIVAGVPARVVANTRKDA